jgi:ABC-type glycerol-3-phosphate transport system substrate-binding protein
VLRVWQTETDKRAKEVLQNMKQAFEAKYSNVDVQIESVGWSSLADKISSAVRNDSPPDLAHLEPFMVYELVKDNLLLPITDVVADLEKEHGPIYPGVKDLQKYADNYYGIAYAVGTTAYAYRKDVAKKLGLSAPRTWKEYIAFVRAIFQTSGGKLPALLPGGDPFFIDQLFAELVANDGGRLFDASKRPPEPLMESRPVLETLQFFQDLAPYVDPGWRTRPYLDQFDKLATGKAGNVLVTYARAFRAIEANEKNLPPGVLPTPDFFAWMPQPTGPSFVKTSARPSISTIDCEPFVIFRKAETRKSAQGGLSNAELSKLFLKDFFYNPTYYLDFVKAVPIHLTPIFKSMAESQGYLEAPAIQHWAQWADQTNEGSYPKSVTALEVL